jgi:hypothetical protein
MVIIYFSLLLIQNFGFLSVFYQNFGILSHKYGSGHAKISRISNKVEDKHN